MKQSLRNCLCDVFCPYYKPSKKSNLVCRGFLIIEELIKTGKINTFKKPDETLNSTTVKKIAGNICTVCFFSEDGCDFMLGNENALPCGGLIALSLMVEKGMISIDDIKNII